MQNALIIIPFRNAVSDKLHLKCRNKLQHPVGAFSYIVSFSSTSSVLRTITSAFSTMSPISAAPSLDAAATSIIAFAMVDIAMLFS